MRRQCELLAVNRSTFYYQSNSSSIDDVELLNQIRDIWMRRPMYGYRRITTELRASGTQVNRKRVQRLMQLGNIQAIHPGPNTSRRNKQHATYPYLLKDLAIKKPNEVWQIDITYLRMGNGFMYLVALIDVYSRFIVGWSLSNSLDTSCCIDALHLAIKLAMPTIINSDQGCQFTSDEWIKALKGKQIKISMTGKGRCLDNIYIERFWRSFKQEAFYLNDYQTVHELKIATAEYIKFYNYQRWHQSLNYKRPADIYFGNVDMKKPGDIWTSPSDQPAPWGQTMDNANALPTA